MNRILYNDVFYSELLKDKVDNNWADNVKKNTPEFIGNGVIFLPEYIGNNSNCEVAYKRNPCRGNVLENRN